MNRDRYTQQQVINALVQACGIKAAAAQALKCSRQTITNYIDRYPAVKAAYDEAIQTSIDLAQSKLIVLVEREEWPAIRFMIVTLGKGRGFTERSEIQEIDPDRLARHRQFEEEVGRVYDDDND